MKVAFLIFEIIMILGQMFHSYWVMNYASNLPERSNLGKVNFNPKQIQALIMCGAFDASIIFSMSAGIYWWVFLGIGILMVFNFFYVYNSTEDLRNDKRNNESKYSRRRQFVMYFISVINPAGVGIFAYLYTLST